MSLRKVFLLYLVGINLVNLVLMGTDKHRAVTHRWRIPERTFFFLSLLGGSAGGLLGILLFHHKTAHRSFSVGIPAILIAQVLVALFLILRTP